MGKLKRVYRAHNNFLGFLGGWSVTKYYGRAVIFELVNKVWGSCILFENAVGGFRLGVVLEDNCS